MPTPDVSGDPIVESPTDRVRWWLVRRAARGRLTWTLSLAILLAAFAGGAVLPAIDLKLGARYDWWPAMDSGVTTTVLSIIAGAMITLAGLVFTALATAMQVGVSSLSVRIIPLFQSDKVMRGSMAVFVSAFGYCVVVAFAVGFAPSGFRPVLSTLVAAGFVVFGALCFIAVVDRVLRLLNPATLCDIMADIGQRSLHGRIATFRRTQPRMPVRSPRHEDAVVTFGRDPSAGEALIAVYTRRIRAMEHREGVTIELLVTLGATLTSETPIFAVSRDGAAAPEAASALRTQLLGSVAVGDAYAPRNGPLGAIRTLVDIALKALSPAVNDPSRAVQVLDALQEMLVEIAEHLTDDEALGRHANWPRAWRDYVSLATDEIRHYGTSSVQIQRRLRAMYESLIESLPDELHPPLAARLAALDESVEPVWSLAIDRKLAATPDPMGLGSPEV